MLQVEQNPENLLKLMEAFDPPRISKIADPATPAPR
jgi:hypothetical protein